MPLPSTRPLSPSILSALSRFRRVVIASVLIFVIAFAIYSLVSGPHYAGKAAIVISPPPSSLHPFAGNGTTPASNVEKQVALLESLTVSNGAAVLVNQKIPSAHITGQDINSHLTVKPQTGVASGLNPTTNVTVTNGNAEVAAASANAVIQSYLAASHLLIRQQAAQSVAAIDQQIAATQSELDQLPSVGSTTRSTTTTTTRPPKVINPPRTTTTHPHSTTTTHPPHTTTTHAPRTTTTTSAPTTTTNAPASTTEALRAGRGPAQSPLNRLCNESPRLSSLRPPLPLRPRQPRLLPLLQQRRRPARRGTRVRARPARRQPRTRTWRSGLR